MSWLRFSRAISGPAPALVAIAVVLGLYAIPPLRVNLFQRLEAASYDLRLVLESKVRPVPEAPELTLIEINDNSLEMIGRWPWPRQIWADVVDSLTELGARAVFFDITFPDPAVDLFQTRDGRVPLQEAVAFSILRAEQSILVSSAYQTQATSAVPRMLEDGFRELRDELTALLPRPDEVVADSLFRARSAHVITGGVATVLMPDSPEQARRDEALARDIRAVAADTTKPATGELELWRQALRLFEKDSSPELFGPGVSPELRDFVTHRLNDIRRAVITAHTHAQLGAAPLDQVDVHELFARAVPPDYRDSRLAVTVMEQALSARLLDRQHLLDVPGLEHLPRMRLAPNLLLPTFSLARAYDLMGADNEIKDPDGTFRSVPLLWKHDGRSLPSAGLSLFLHALAGPGAQRPKLAVLPGPALSIERPSGQPPLTVPLTPDGDMLIHWTGPFATTFSHLPAATLINYALGVREREEFLSKLSRDQTFADTLTLRDRARDLAVRAPGKPLSLEELAPRMFAGSGAASLRLYFTTSRIAEKPSSTTERRTPAAWHKFLVELVQERQTSLLAGFQFQLDAIAREKDPARRAEKEAKVRTKLAPYFRFVHRQADMHKELASRLAGKICIIGHTASSSTDLGSMAFESRYPKVASYAATYNTLASERFLRRPAALAWTLGGLLDPVALQLPLLLLVCFGLAFLLPSLTSGRGFFIAIALCFAWAFTACVLFISHGFWIDMVAPTAGAALTYIFVVTLRNRRTERVRHMFETYVDPRIVKVVVEDESLWRELGGHEARITAFFSDIANFTTLSEMLTPQEVSQMLTDYLSPMTDILLDHDGTRDKYIGDAIVAFFGAPLPGEGHELQACLASIEQQERALRLKAEWRANGVSWYAKLLAAGTDLTFRIGLNTGQAKVGNFGSLKSKNYTMIGDSVNLASRLEGANKEYGTLIMASETTVAACGDKIVKRELDRIVVKGRKEAVKVFEVIGRTGHVAAHVPELLERYDRALAHYHRREFAQARAAFAEMCAKWPEDGPARVYLGRCDAFLVTPPPDDWDGSFKMLHK